MLDHQPKPMTRAVVFGGGKLEPWNVEASRAAKNCKNLIREIVDSLDLQPNPEKSVIALSIGDPTVYGNLTASTETIEAIVDVAQENTFNGYTACVGHEKSREAVARYLSFDGSEFKPSDIILCSGCSSSLEMCITVLADGSKNHNILMPRPGFCIYRTHAESIGVKVNFYNLLPEKNWEIDLDHLESQIDQNTAVIILNNPSNPCGSVYSEEHLKDVLEIAYRHRIPVIADEIYERLVFSGKKFVSTASLHSGVPILICGGLAKRFLVPGWRLGWIAIHDEIGAFSSEIRKGLQSLSQRTIGSNTLVQGALPRIVENTPQSFHDNLIRVLEGNARLAFESLQNAKGLTPFMPEGTMYMMVELQLNRFPYDSSMEFATKLMEEESVFCLPGEAFMLPGFLRIVLTIPEDLLQEACVRISEFCNRNFK